MKGKIGKVGFEMENGKMFEVDIERDLSINDGTIDEDIMTQSGKYAWVSTLYSRAKTETAKNKLRLEILIAELSKKHRLQLGATLEKKPTESQIQSEVITDEKYKKVNITYIKSKENESILKGLVEAYAQRKDMIQTFASNLRQERDIKNVIRSEKVDSKLRSKR